MNIQEALKIIKPAIPNKASIPALEGACVRAGKITGFDLSVAISAKIDLPDMIIPKKAIDLILQADEEVHISYSGSALTVKFGNAKSKFTTFPVEDFPLLPEVQEMPVSTVDGTELNKAIQRVSYAVAKSETKPIHTGVRLVDGLAVAIDGVRLATATVSGECDLVIPPTAFKALRGIASGNLTICKTASHIIFNSGDVTIISRAMNGEFLDYKKVLPNRDSFFQVDRNEALKILSNLNLLQHEKIKTPCIIEVKNREMALSIKTSHAEYTDKIDVDTDKEYKIGINSFFLAESIKSLDGDFEISFGSAVEPIVLRTKEQTAMILPVRIKD